MVGPPGHQLLKILMRWRPGARVSVPPCGVGRHMLDTRASVSVDSRRGPTLSVRHHFADGKMKAQCSELLTRGLSPPNLCTPTQREMLGVVPQEVLEVLAPSTPSQHAAPSLGLLPALRALLSGAGARAAGRLRRDSEPPR